MNISEHLTQQQFQEIILKIYKLGHESDNLGAKDLVKEIELQILSVVAASAGLQGRRKRNAVS